MKIKENNPPRVFGPLDDIQLKDCAHLVFSKDEQITIYSEDNKSNDIVCKEWCFYLANSLNHRLKKQNYKIALVASYASSPTRTYINLVDKSKMDIFNQYCKKYNAKVICWLDDFLSDDHH
ncbi:MAG: hypothetical protein AAF403_05310 [Pseudomonadota bacterium]